MSAKPRGVHLVGSVPLDTEEEVFKVVGRALGRHLRRLPDGETGGRKDWVQFELFRLGGHPDFELVPFNLEGVVEEAMTLSSARASLRPRQTSVISAMPRWRCARSTRSAGRETLATCPRTCASR